MVLKNPFMKPAWSVKMKNDSLRELNSKRKKKSIDTVEYKKMQCISIKDAERLICFAVR